jgi:hypothetical protein
LRNSIKELRDHSAGSGSDASIRYCRTSDTLPAGISSGTRCGLRTPIRWSTPGDFRVCDPRVEQSVFSSFATPCCKRFAADLVERFNFRQTACGEHDRSAHDPR